MLKKNELSKDDFSPCKTQMWNNKKCASDEHIQDAIKMNMEYNIFTVCFLNLI